MAGSTNVTNASDQASSSSSPTSFWLRKPGILKIRSQRRASAPSIEEDPAGQHAEEHIDDDAGAAPPRQLRPASTLNGSRSGSATPLDPRDSPALQAQDQSLGLDGGKDEIEELDEVVPDRIEFFAPHQPYFWLSNAAPYEIVLDGVRYPTAEHCFQSLKFLPHRPEIARKVRKASTPVEAVRTARKHTADVQRGWRRDGLNLVNIRRVMLLKFSQHTALRKALLQTGNAQLVNAVPTDVFWGNGGGRGRNEFGKALASVREVLRTIDLLGAGSGAITV
ncbi:unnamed protein product [Tilletia laevis]|uniref:NADAR domain-containing protein n=2 Tax=Tilletia TaxID=13289 RepID=A0A177V3S3_9BASI|nr:hypothetical protein CF336_g8444 [Tilletia laevis]KAE8261488.1 hypothetical protein A4X03_0g3213 [Tilletia caries]KAE8196741.1 hypothetical protein CF335_g4785 [Tilletia laevis]CAD6893834.1 unnamed protein product [Tilletia caries]CAD6897019.1 unnamed protein product [Tilletia laevis]